MKTHIAKGYNGKGLSRARVFMEFPQIRVQWGWMGRHGGIYTRSHLTQNSTFGWWADRRMLLLISRQFAEASPIRKRGRNYFPTTKLVSWKGRAKFTFFSTSATLIPLPRGGQEMASRRRAVMECTGLWEEWPFRDSVRRAGSRGVPGARLVLSQGSRTTMSVSSSDYVRHAPSFVSQGNTPELCCPEVLLGLGHRDMIQKSGWHLWLRALTMNSIVHRDVRWGPQHWANKTTLQAGSSKGL